MCGERPRRCELRLPPPPWAELPPPRELRNILAHATLRPTLVRTFAPPSVHPSRARESSLGITFRGFPRRGGRCARISFFFTKQATQESSTTMRQASPPPLNGISPPWMVYPPLEWFPPWAPLALPCSRNGDATRGTLSLPLFGKSGIVFPARIRVYVGVLWADELGRL